MSDRQFQESKRIALQRQGWHCLRCGTNIHDPSLWPGRSGHHRQLRRRADPAVRDLPCNIVELCGSGTTGCHGWAHAHPAEAERFELAGSAQRADTRLERRLVVAAV